MRGAGDLSAFFDAADETDGLLAPDYNVAPTDPVPVVRLTTRPPGAPRAAAGTGGAAPAGPPRRVLSLVRWGLVPHWAKDPRAGARMINARSEGVATSATYRRYFGTHRCLVPAEGWFEWKGRGRPYFMTGGAGGPLVFAGLWAAHPAVPGGLTCTILTTAAVGPLAGVHDRMPLLLPRDRWADWLAGPASPALLAPPPPESVAALEIRPVGPAVGDVRNDGPDLVARVSAPAAGEPPATLF
ncbi:DUF159 family protein [Pilimelia terevasa]|uniref:Abasic site processing protein n=1 Tax=Pilimelia terevasa TaxID=53372 RepID=A0A8J3BGA1_9ACTN|nr:DUF159 family protein [Pilimelia terevasa]